MRLVASVPDESIAMHLRGVLSKEGIEHTCEAKEEEGKRVFYFWVHNEDELDKALEIYQNLDKHEHVPPEPAKRGPDDIKVEVRPRGRSIKGNVTRLIIALCIFLYIFNHIQERSLSKAAPAYGTLRPFTPVDENLMYDFPEAYVALNTFLKQNPDFKLEEKTPLELRQEYQKIDAIPTWRGLYSYFLAPAGAKPSLDVPMFVKIKQGQIWRLFTPALLHAGFLHILFNMLWLWFLGKFAEHNLKISRYLILSLVLAVVSNTCQYLASGPNFLGYSGVIAGLAGYIWVRQKVAPWEDYPIPRGVFIFLALFIFGMVAFQAAAYLLHKISIGTFSLSVANTAHVTGFFAGMICAKIPYFEAR